MRNKYIIEITETLQKQITVFSESKEKALDSVQKKYSNSDIVLDYSDFIECKIGLIKNDIHIH